MPIKKKKAGRPIVSDEERAKPTWYRPHNDVRKHRKKPYWTTVRVNELGEAMVRWFEENHEKVSLGAFCWEHKIPRDYIGKFAAKNRFFTYCVQVVKSLLETRLLEMGMSGEIDKVMAIFSLKNIADWTDKKEVNSNIEITSKIVELKLPKKKKPIEVKHKVIDERPVEPEEANTTAPTG